jgi:hypothetical protein
MMYYISYVFTMAGVGSTSSVLLSSSIQYVINVIMTVPALLFVDVWGRRPTLLVGALLMMTWMFANAGLVATYGVPAYPGEFSSNAESFSISGPPSKALIACTYLFVASYAPTWGPVSWIYPPELYPLRVRGKAVALATSANWAFVGKEGLCILCYMPEGSSPTEVLETSGRGLVQGKHAIGKHVNMHVSAWIHARDRWKVSASGSSVCHSSISYDHVPVEIEFLRLVNTHSISSTPPSISSAFNFALAYFVPPAFQNIGWKTYLLFGIFLAAMFIHVFFLFPETASKPLEEVEEIFNDNTPGSIKYIGTPAWKTHVDRNARRMERGEMDPDEKFTFNNRGEANRVDNGPASGTETSNTTATTAV